MSRRSALAFVIVAAAALVPAATGSAALPAHERGGPAPARWAGAQVAAVVAAGAMGPDVVSFRPADPLTRGELHLALVALGKRSTAPADPSRQVTIAELDARLVSALGLSDAAASIRAQARDAGLAPTASIGTETVARLLGLRVNHPNADEHLELQLSQPATREEAAWSLARVLELTDAQVAAVGAKASSFALPTLDPAQQEVVGRSLRFVGSPYVWAGTSEKPQQLYYGSAPGGFDCSGFAWRVFKLQPVATSPGVGDRLVGRTTYALSGEVKPAQRLGLAKVAPGDLVFFGRKGVASAPAEVIHMGISVGNGWFVHSSSNGVTLQPLEGWYRTSFAWARRPLAEAASVAA